MCDTSKFFHSKVSENTRTAMGEWTNKPQGREDRGVAGLVTTGDPNVINFKKQPLAGHLVAHALALGFSSGS